MKKCPGFSDFLAVHVCVVGVETCACVCACLCACVYEYFVCVGEMVECVSVCYACMCVYEGMVFMLVCICM